jgi:putative SOS response-associated peptidase YedK
MCGRALIHYTKAELFLRYPEAREELPLPDKLLALDFRPSQFTWVLTSDLKFRRASFGFETGSKLRPLNARSETLFEKTLFRSSALTRRGILPLSGYYEWLTESLEPDLFQSDPLHGPPRPKGAERKTRYQISSSRWPILSVGVILSGTDPDTFAILTRPAVPDLKTIHDRMPWILSNETEERAWLSSRTSTAELQTLVEKLRAYDLGPFTASAATHLAS